MCVILCKAENGGQEDLKALLGKSKEERGVWGNGYDEGLKIL